MLYHELTLPFSQVQIQALVGHTRYCFRAHFRPHRRLAGFGLLLQRVSQCRVFSVFLLVPTESYKTAQLIEMAIAKFGIWIQVLLRNHVFRSGSLARTSSRRVTLGDVPDTPMLRGWAILADVALLMFVAVLPISRRWVCYDAALCYRYCRSWLGIL